MRYVSTRGGVKTAGFEDVLLGGYASDGGLYVPESLPHFSAEEIASWAWLPYPKLAFKVMWPFVEGSLDKQEFMGMVERAYKNFDHAAVAPLRQLQHGEWVLELFHGPTQTFKDFSMQVLGQLLEHFLSKRNERAVLIGATTGDTGAAAIEGCRHVKRADIFILHAKDGISESQLKQMTRYQDENVHNLAIEGDFDQCHELVRKCFTDSSLSISRRLVAINSVNWVRIISQVAYYFYSALQLGAPTRQVAFSVPTGNFGDVYSGYVARNMGLQINQLIVATNRNDILHRFLSKNEYRKEQRHTTIAPSLDVVASSNLERLLFDLHDKNGDAIAELMKNFESFGCFELEKSRWLEARTLFDSLSLTDEEIEETITDVQKQTGAVLEPHTAIAAKAATVCRRSLNSPIVIMGTAHSKKIPNRVSTMDSNSSGNQRRDEVGTGRLAVIPNDFQRLNVYIASTVIDSGAPE